MIAGIDFPSYFDADNYALRHVTGHNMLDPEGVITGREIGLGFTPYNSRRFYASFGQYQDAVCGNILMAELTILCPRVSVI